MGFAGRACIFAWYSQSKLLEVLICTSSYNAVSFQLSDMPSIPSTQSESNGLAKNPVNCATQISNHNTPFVGGML